MTKDEKEVASEEIDRLRDEVVRRMANTPPKPTKHDLKMKAKTLANLEKANSNIESADEGMDYGI